MVKSEKKKKIFAVIAAQSRLFLSKESATANTAQFQNTLPARVLGSYWSDYSIIAKSLNICMYTCIEKNKTFQLSFFYHSLNFLVQSEVFTVSELLRTL